MGFPVIRATSDSSSTTSTLIDADQLAQYADNHFIGAWYYSPVDDFDYQITDSIQSSGTINFRPTAAGAPDSEAYEILPFPGRDIHAAIDHALRDLFAVGKLTRRVYVPIVTGSPIFNGQPAFWPSSSTLDGWTVSGSTLAQGTAGIDRWVGESVASLTSADGTLALDAEWRRFLADQMPATLKLYAWMRAANPATARVNIVTPGGTTNGTAHSGDGEWEVQRAELSIGADQQEWFPQLERLGAGGADVDFGEVWVEGGGVPLEHPIPIGLLPDGPEEILLSDMNIDEGNSRARVRPDRAQPWRGWQWRRYTDSVLDYGVITWTQRPPAGRRAWLVGPAPFTLPTVDSSVIELDEWDAQFVCKIAALKVYEGWMNRVPNSVRVKWSDTVSRLTRDINILYEESDTESDSSVLGYDVQPKGAGRRFLR